MKKKTPKQLAVRIRSLKKQVTKLEKQRKKALAAKKKKAKKRSKAKRRR